MKKQVESNDISGANIGEHKKISKIYKTKLRKDQIYKAIITDVQKKEIDTMDGVHHMFKFRIFVQKYNEEIIYKCNDCLKKGSAFYEIAIAVLGYRPMRRTDLIKRMLNQKIKISIKRKKDKDGNILAKIDEFIYE